MVALRWCEEDETGQQPETAVRALGAGREASGRRRDLRVVPPAAPQSVVVGRQFGPVGRRRPQTFFWRRAFAVSVIVGLGTMAWLVTGRLVSAAGAPAPQGQHCLAGGAPADGLAPGSCGQVYVARPGDTIWSIAASYSGNGDPRPLVAKLESQIGGGVLQPGERLVVP